MLTKRDKAIIADLNKFRAMDRDSIAELHFANLKSPHTAANNVLLRLLRDGHIQRSTAFTPYVYFGPDVSMKQTSAKIPHFLAILDVYKELKALGALESFMVEPKFGGKKDGYAEPDIYCLFRNTPFFIEVQRTVYSTKQMNEKMERYRRLHDGDLFEQFPRVLILSDQRYAIDSGYPFRVFQAESFTQFINSLKPAQPVQERKANGGMRMQIKKAPN